MNRKWKLLILHYKYILYFCTITLLISDNRLRHTYIHTYIRYSTYIGMGVFKAVWTNVVIVEVIRLFEVHYVKSGSDSGGQRLSFLSFTSILNNIVIPCMSLSLASPDCFYNLLYSRGDVSSSYNIGLSIGFGYISEAIMFESKVMFTPPYTYSYQCSSAILTS